MPVICADCCSGYSATFQRHILYSHRRGAANQVGMLVEDVDGCLSTDPRAQPAAPVAQSQEFHDPRQGKFDL